MFNPTEIIFSATTLCNLHCAHCFVNRSTTTLNAKDAIKFLESCRDSENCQIDKIGFSGGEPFLALDFMCAVIEFAYKNDFMFDQIMTNGVWWKTEDQLNEVLKKLYDAGYDGKIGISYDNFHGQNYEKIRTFCTAVNNIFGDESIVIQAVSDPELNDEKTGKLENELNALCEDFNADIYVLPQSFQAENEHGWQSSEWFEEDYCEGPGNILFVHPDGNIAPCCGFANENEDLLIGNISESFDRVMENAKNNKMIKLCYESGLLKFAKELEKSEMELPGKGFTNDICTFCDFVCKLK